jgi:hypothetical protein
MGVAVVDADAAARTAARVLPPAGAVEEVAAVAPIGEAVLQ